jgi:hypothetical protein
MLNIEPELQSREFTDDFDLSLPERLMQSLLEAQLNHQQRLENIWDATMGRESGVETFSPFVFSVLAGAEVVWFELPLIGEAARDQIKAFF